MSNIKNLVLTSIIASLYIVLTIAFVDLSYSAVQFRISEILTVLPVFSPIPIIGLTLGCFISNIYGVMILKTMPQDIIFGTLATLIAAVLCYYIAGKSKQKSVKYILGPLPTVIVNSVIVGLEITIFAGGNLFLNSLYVGLGELAVCYLLGVPLIFALYKNNLYKKIFSQNKF